MANQEHLNIIRQGVEVWNAWRKVNATVRPDLEEADLEEADLRGADLEEADLRGAHLEEAHLEGAALSRAYLRGAHLEEADLSEAHLEEADLRGADLRGAHLRGADLSGAHLQGAHLEGADLQGADLRGADLSGAHLEGADLQGADLRGADLQGADLQGADLSGADLRGAHLSGAHLSGAHLSGAHLQGANLHSAFIGGTTFGVLDLRGVTGLETVQHLYPSTIGIDTLYQSDGHIPEVFLRGCGVPDAFIEYIPSLVGAVQPIQYYSCFISYSSKDEAFAKRLHERMRAEHLRVWFAPEDMEGGKKVHEQIDRAIQLHDRLLLVLSEQSIQSEWVMTEIRRARYEEIKEQRRKLFPIRVMDYAALESWECMDSRSSSDLAEEVRQYFIPDFSTWKDHDAFETAFAKLLRDLRAAEPPAPGSR